MGNTTVTYYNLELEVYYNYQPEEKEVKYYKDGSGYPGCAEEFEITNVVIEGTDYDLIDLLSEKQLIELEERIKENKYKDYEREY